jgi:hypothetical protein
LLAGELLLMYVETTIGGSKNFPRINFRPQDGLLGTR